ncbi:hypothetical protein, partial [uncultured Ornithinimicrobium sp.]|uniref:hypothetical protein n=1 Tax=uncultured Ornithinimicrobium sp. TaxID=259307 RepID=UPI002597207A
MSADLQRERAKQAEALRERQHKQALIEKQRSMALAKNALGESLNQMADTIDSMSADASTVRMSLSDEGALLESLASDLARAQTEDELQRIRTSRDEVRQRLAARRADIAMAIQQEALRERRERADLIASSFRKRFRDLQDEARLHGLELQDQGLEALLQQYEYAGRAEDPPPILSAAPEIARILDALVERLAEDVEAVETRLGIIEAIAGALPSLGFSCDPGSLEQSADGTVVLEARL